jgi:hypothetical protein
MTDVTRILSAIEQGDPHAAEQLLPLVYDELRKLAAQKLAHEAPGQTLQATALVHEAYLRLVASPRRQAGEAQPHWNSRGHFFAAAAEAARRVVGEIAQLLGELHQDDLGHVLGVGVLQLPLPAPAVDVPPVTLDERVPGGLVRRVLPQARQ